jgi:hypothetical protein
MRACCNSVEGRHKKTKKLNLLNLGKYTLQGPYSPLLLLNLIILVNKIREVFIRVRQTCTKGVTCNISIHHFASFIHNLQHNTHTTFNENCKCNNINI